jgi:hypothetical protein
VRIFSRFRQVRARRTDLSMLNSLHSNGSLISLDGAALVIAVGATHDEGVADERRTTISCGMEGL